MAAGVIGELKKLILKTSYSKMENKRVTTPRLDNKKVATHTLKALREYPSVFIISFLGANIKGGKNMNYDSLLAIAGAQDITVTVSNNLHTGVYFSTSEIKVIMLPGEMTLAERTRELAVMIGYSILTPKGYNIISERDHELEKRLKNQAESYADGLMSGKVAKRLIALPECKEK